MFPASSAAAAGVLEQLFGRECGSSPQFKAALSPLHWQRMEVKTVCLPDFTGLAGWKVLLPHWVKNPYSSF